MTILHVNTSKGSFALSVPFNFSSSSVGKVAQTIHPCIGLAVSDNVSDVIAE